MAPVFYRVDALRGITRNEKNAQNDMAGGVTAVLVTRARLFQSLNHKLHKSSAISASSGVKLW